MKEWVQDSERTVSVRTQLAAGKRVERQPMEAESTAELSLQGQALLVTHMGRRQRTYL